MALFCATFKRVVNQKLLQSLKWTQTHLRNESASSQLLEILEKKIKTERVKILKFKKKFGHKVISKTDINQTYGGMRGITCIVWETSLLDPEEGIRFRGMTIPEIKKALPQAEGGKEPLPEGIFWLLVTDEVPTEKQVKLLSEEWAKRAKLPEHVYHFLKTVPTTLHPMCQFSCAVALLNNDSAFKKAYDRGVHKLEYWRYIYEDAMCLIANLPIIAAIIYVKNFKDGKLKAEIDLHKDWSYNYSKMIGFDCEKFIECMRMYLTIHCDHEGGNVSAHTSHVVGSALADPFISFASGLNGLAGPLHGLANQEVLRWIMKLQDALGHDPKEDEVKQFIKDTLKISVVPGFGHAVLRKTDPRYSCQREFALNHLPDDPMFKIVKMLYTLVPPELQALRKVKNPWPNVDAHSGVLLQFFGMKEMDYYTVLFGMSRALGVMAQHIWSRALLLPIERPKSITTKDLMKQFNYNPD